tara:strand:+ start:1127 stop:1297 length:171 start_codon:yes stop_codon:yes gene_type:complete
MNTDDRDAVKNFCMIQIEIVKERVRHLRKEILNCKIQEEFLMETLKKLGSEQDEKN